MSRVPFVTSKSLTKSANYQIRTIYALQGSSMKLVDPPIPRPASPTAPSRATAQQNQSSTQNPPAPSSSLKAPNSSSSATLLCPLPGATGQLRNFPSWFTASSTQQQLPAHYRFSSAAHGIPKPRAMPLPDEDKELNSAVQVGEDAYFVASTGLGVADGVGGWSSSKHASRPGSSSAHAHRANSALFSRRLMHFCSLELENSDGEPDPVDILQKAYTTAVRLSKAEGLVGSSTALLAVLSKDGKELRVAHVGDCCLYLIRERELVFRSEEMQHRFNYPLQLGPLSPTTPQDHAQSIVLPIQEHDVIILSTDGMSDNLWDEDVLEQLSRLSPPASTPSTSSASAPPHAPTHAAGIENETLSSKLRAALLPTTLSHSLATRARTVSEHYPSPSTSPTSSSGTGLGTSPPSSPDTPFSRRAQQEGIDFVGGKPDDITVVVAVVSRVR